MKKKSEAERLWLTPNERKAEAVRLKSEAELLRAKAAYLTELADRMEESTAIAYY